jgi:hypothetical protein
MKAVEGRPVGDYKVLYEAEEGNISLHSWIVKSNKGNILNISLKYFYLENILQNLDRRVKKRLFSVL